MIDVAICSELPTRAEHPLKWCIVGGVIYDGGPLWRLAGAYCAGRVWHGRPRSEQAWDAQAAWPEQCLMGLSIKSAKQQVSTGWGATDIVQRGATRGWVGCGRGGVDTCQKMWVGLTMMKQNVCHLSMSVQGWGGMSSWGRGWWETETEMKKTEVPTCLLSTVPLTVSF